MEKKAKKKIKRLEFEIKLISDKGRLPKKATRGAIGYDLYVPRDTRIPAHSRFAVPLDIALNLPYGIEAKIEPRSGCSLRGMEGYGTKTYTKKILGLFNVKKTKSGRMYFDCDVMVGKVDPNYVDNIHVLLKNNDEEFVIRAGSRIAQLTFYQTSSPFFKIVDTLTCKSRGGGLGHTGISSARYVDRHTPTAIPTKEEGEDLLDRQEGILREFTAEEVEEILNTEKDSNPAPENSQEEDNDNYGAHV